MKRYYSTTLLLLFLFQMSFGQISFQEHVISTNANFATSVFAADLNGDGNKDVISFSRFDSKIAWYDNVDGLGGFSEEIIVSDDIQNAGSVYAADLDGDGDIDIISAASASSNAGEVCWFKNLDGFGNFSPKIVISQNNQYSISVIAADMDGDNDLDVVTPMAWYRNNDGNGNFSDAIPIPSIVTSYLPKAVYAADLDGDGDLDLVTVRSDGTNGRSIWHENYDGLGSFYSSNSYILPGQYGGLSDVCIADVDSDGDNDIVVTSSDNSVDNSVVRVYLNSGNGNFTGQTIATAAQYRAVFSSDINNDGNIDIIAASSGYLHWFDSAQGFSENTMNFSFYNSITDVYAADLDNDGDVDILSASSNDDSIIFLENMGVLGNEIVGTVKLNLPTSDCNENNIYLPNILVSSDDGGSNSFSTFTQENGDFQIPINIGEFTTTTYSPSNYNSNPSSVFIEFTDLGNTEDVDFCMEPINVINDLNIVIYPSINNPRPGFDTTYQLVYKNIGTTQLSGSVAFEFDDTKLQFLNASETISSQTSSSLTFGFTSLNPFETRIIDLEFNVFAPPTTEIDDELVAIATINPVLGDETEDDNVFELQQTVIGSYDPNDIAVLEGDQILIEDVDKYLHYLIRFQNTGTASAINVTVENVLDDKLDWTTMQLENLSHTGRVDILNGSEVSFVFDNINLPDSSSDESNSHGFIAYKIKPKDNVVLGDIFYNTAAIYFDYNPPIITNTVSTEIVEDQLSISEFENDMFKVFPNPTDSKLTIQSKDGMSEINIVDINGRLLKTFQNLDSSTDVVVDVGSLSSGIYFLKIQVNSKKQVVRFIKN
ncbi:T9SS type A sorting domain-containing protein [Psychroserpens ponticola]|uniref:T9SS type A sorting domain-containing protein n=1 Tax=Psychroserpens ponticola TaxID=2932268 RepID=A0ABY7RUS3_9FLAO|nr:T9SS type A sorting domain-containing protein [Psychroserpens ponticola]WCO00425.1 T9SS type A sorting domain-containing protein [Psychroserpens ponticola]